MLVPHQPAFTFIVIKTLIILEHLLICKQVLASSVGFGAFSFIFLQLIFFTEMHFPPDACISLLFHEQNLHHLTLRLPLYTRWSDDQISAFHPPGESPHTVQIMAQRTHPQAGGEGSRSWKTGTRSSDPTTAQKMWSRLCVLR